MTTNQTIDGVLVPRELLESLLTDACNENWSDLNELLHSATTCRCKRYGKGNPHWPCPAHPAPAAQPQGEPVAWTEADALDFMSVALRHAEYSGLAPSDILEGLRYMAEKGKAAYYAEQPVPVAVAPSCCGSCPGGCVYGLKA